MAETERALELDPGNQLALINLAKLRFGTDDISGAWEVLNKLPASAEVHNLRGFVKLAQRKTELAIEQFKIAIDLNNRLGEPYMGLGLAYMRQEKTKEAFKAIATAVLLEPQRSMFYSYWGKMLHQVKRFDKALEVLDHARNLDPNDPTPEFYRAIVLRDLYRPGEAIRGFNKAIKLNKGQKVEF